MRRTIVHAVISLALTLGFLAPLPALAAEVKSNCAQLAQSAQRLDQITAEVRSLAGRVDATGGDLAAAFRGREGAAFQSSLMRTRESMSIALKAMDETLELAHSQCAQYTPRDTQLLSLHQSQPERTNSQPWNFAAVEAGLGTLHSDVASLAALADEWRSVRGDFGAAHQRAGIKLGEAVQALAFTAQVASEATAAMGRTEQP